MDEKLIGLLSLCFDKAPEDAINFLKSKGVKITWDWQEQLKAIKQNAFTVAKVASADILQTFKNELQRALTDGQTYDAWKSDINVFLDQKGYTARADGSAWRLDTIYRTNLQSAYMAGRYHQMKEVADTFPYWEFIAVMDSRTTNICKDINGVILRQDDPFWSVNYPPRHYRCRSRVRAVSAPQLATRGLNLTDPKTVKGVQPAEGFATAPGEWHPDLSGYDSSLSTILQNVLEHK